MKTCITKSFSNFVLYCFGLVFESYLAVHIPGSVLRNQTCRCSQDPVWCWRLNLHWLHTNYLTQLQTFKHICNEMKYQSIIPEAGAIVQWVGHLHCTCFTQIQSLAPHMVSLRSTKNDSYAQREE